MSDKGLHAQKQLPRILGFDQALSAAHSSSSHTSLPGTEQVWSGKEDSKNHVVDIPAGLELETPEVSEFKEWTGGRSMQSPSEGQTVKFNIRDGKPKDTSSESQLGSGAADCTCPL